MGAWYGRSSADSDAGLTNRWVCGLMALDCLPLAKLGIRAWRNGLKHPIYVPVELSSIRVRLSHGKVADAIAELRRLATLGSDSASATLAVLCSIYRNVHSEDSNAAMRLCIDSANRGFGYAQYALAWNEHRRGNNRELAKWLQMATRGGFAPAMGDLGLLLIAPGDISARRASVAKRLFILAMRRGHLPSVLSYLQGCRRGRFGERYRLFGLILSPIATSLMVPVLWLCPFSFAVCAYPPL